MSGDDLVIKAGSVRIPDGAAIEVHPPDMNSNRWSIRLGEGALWLHMSAETLYSLQLAIATARDVDRDSKQPVEITYEQQASGARRIVSMRPVEPEVDLGG